MRGYAIEIKHSGWMKRPGEGATFQQLQSHYVGSFSKTHAQAIYIVLNNILEKESEKRKTATHPKPHWGRNRK